MAVIPNSEFSEGDERSRAERCLLLEESERTNVEETKTKRRLLNCGIRNSSETPARNCVGDSPLDSIGLDSEIRWFQRNEKDVVIYDRNTENATPSLSSFHALWERKRFYRHPLCSRNTVAPGASITSFLPTQPSLAVFPPFCSFPPLSLSLSNLQSPVDQKKRSRRRRRKRRGLESPRSIVIQRLLIINLQRGRRKRKRDSRCLLSSIERMWFIIRSNNDSYEGINY